MVLKVEEKQLITINLKKVRFPFIHGVCSCSQCRDPVVILHC